MNAVILSASPASSRARMVMLTVFAVVLVWSGVEPKDRFTWVLEVCPRRCWVWACWRPSTAATARAT